MCQYCLIVPRDVIARFAKDRSLPGVCRKSFSATKRLDSALRGMRRNMALVSHQALVAGRKVRPPKRLPANLIHDCQNAAVLPGRRVPRPESSADETVRRAYSTTADVARFFRDVFARHSLDGAGMALISSVHYGVRYNNAFWNGMQMTYGDGDGHIFIDFTRSNDVICHELMHGVTQYTLGLNYENEPGGLNESLSDVFGAMFRQWQAGQDAAQADWLIGAEIMGPSAAEKGYRCLRSLAEPGAAFCMAPQPMHYSAYRDGMDPHESSGIPNHAFHAAAMAIGGKSWEKAGAVWYRVLAGTGPRPNMKMADFAARTRAAAAEMFPTEPAVAAAVDGGWARVGL